MDLRQIQYFLCLFEEQSVTRAAKRLNIVQPALSMQIAKLERDINKMLFTRTPRRMIPTPAAEEMYRAFLPLIGEFNRAREKVMHTGDALSGHVRVGVAPSIGHHILPELLEKFSDCYPSITLSISEDVREPLLELVAAGQLDLSYTSRSDKNYAVRTELIHIERIFFVTSAQNILFPPKVTLADLAGQKFVLPTREDEVRHIVDLAFQAEGMHLIPALELDSILSSARLLEKGLFVGMMPEGLLQNLTVRHGLRLKGHRVLNQGLERQIIGSHNPRRPLSEAALAFHHEMSSMMHAK